MVYVFHRESPIRESSDVCALRSQYPPQVMPFKQ